MLGGDLPLADGTVSREHRPGELELVRAAELGRVGLQLEQEPPDPVAGRLGLAGVGIDELAGDAVTDRAPAVLGDDVRGVGRQAVARAETGAERSDERLA